MDREARPRVSPFDGTTSSSSAGLYATDDAAGATAKSKPKLQPRSKAMPKGWEGARPATAASSSAGVEASTQTAPEEEEPREARPRGSAGKREARPRTSSDGDSSADDRKTM